MGILHYYQLMSQTQFCIPLSLLGIVIILEENSFSICNSNADSINPLITVLYVSFCADAVIILNPYPYPAHIWIRFAKLKEKYDYLMIWISKRRNLLYKFSLAVKQIMFFLTTNKSSHGSL